MNMPAMQDVRNFIDDEMILFLRGYRYSPPYIGERCRSFNISFIGFAGSLYENPGMLAIMSSIDLP